MSDPLAAFRKKPILPESQTVSGAPLAVREPYKAFATKDKLRVIDIRINKDGMAHAPGYTYLTNLTYTRPEYDKVLLTLSRMLVTIEGRNLRPIVDAIKLHTCEFIQEFDAQEFDTPTDDKAPFVESITVQLFGPAPSPANTR